MPVTSWLTPYALPEPGLDCLIWQPCAEGYHALGPAVTSQSPDSVRRVVPPGPRL